MNKLELISALKEQANLFKAEAANAVEIFFENMADTLPMEIGWRSKA